MKTEKITVKRGEGEDDWNIEVHAPEDIKGNVELFGLVETEAAIRDSISRQYTAYIKRRMKKGDNEEDVQVDITQRLWHPYCDAPVTETRRLALGFLQLSRPEQIQFKDDVNVLTERQKEYGSINGQLPDIPDETEVEVEQAPAVQPPATVPGYEQEISAEEKAAIIAPAHGGPNNPQARASAQAMPQAMAQEAAAAAAPKLVQTTDAQGNPTGHVKQEGPGPPVTTPIPPVTSLP